MADISKLAARHGNGHRSPVSWAPARKFLKRFYDFAGPEPNVSRHTQTEMQRSETVGPRVIKQQSAGQYIQTAAWRFKGAPKTMLP